MTQPIEISLFGFGDDRPAFFEGKNLKLLTLGKNTSVGSVMLQAGFADTSGLVLMINDTVVGEKQWGTTEVCSGDKLKVLSAFEGG